MAHVALAWMGSVRFVLDSHIRKSLITKNGKK